MAAQNEPSPSKPEPEWRYAVDHSSCHETRHEASGAAAVINGRRRRRDDPRRAKVWSYAVCDCEYGHTNLDSAQVCQRCGEHCER